jgi:hypothetical protein
VLLLEKEEPPWWLQIQDLQHDPGMISSQARSRGKYGPACRRAETVERIIRISTYRFLIV